jgi:hypothetical protein
MRPVFHIFLTYARSRVGKAVLAGAGLVLAGLLVLLVVSGRPLVPWALSGLPELPATGVLPPLSAAMETNPELRARVRALGERDEAWLFVNYKETDKEIAAILLMWAGANMARGGVTPEGLDPRIDTFLRKVYGLGPDDYITGDPVIGDRPWVRWFTHFKPRLLIQLAAQRVYSGKVTYDPRRDRMSVEPRLSTHFMDGFMAFARQQPDPTPYINNLVAFIDSTTGLAKLSASDKARIEALAAQRR